eukprot:1189495-Prorocentrum_minimum.AAC.2
MAEQDQELEILGMVRPAIRTTLCRLLCRPGARLVIVTRFTGARWSIVFTIYYEPKEGHRVQLSPRRPYRQPLPSTPTVNPLTLPPNPSPTPPSELRVGSVRHGQVLRAGVYRCLPLFTAVYHCLLLFTSELQVGSVRHGQVLRAGVYRCLPLLTTVLPSFTTVYCCLPQSSGSDLFDMGKFYER